MRVFLSFMFFSIGEAYSSLPEEVPRPEAKQESDESRDQINKAALKGIMEKYLRDSVNSWTHEKFTKEKNYNYPDPEYWENRYKQSGEEETYEWYGVKWESELSGESGDEFSTVRELIHHYIPKESKIMILGCGNSVWSMLMQREGWHNLVNVDSSATAIYRMAKIFPHVGVWMNAHASNQTFEADTFDVIIEKGMIDAMEGDPALKASAVTEAKRVLKPGGIFLTMTYKSPEHRQETIGLKCENYHIHRKMRAHFCK